jgi:fumarylpyruvate hydrolase
MLMGDYAIPAPPLVLLPATSDKPFLVRRIYCVGRNYADHVKEMGGDPIRDEPFFFMKPADALLQNGETMPYPPATQDLQPEVELVVAMKAGGRNIPPEKVDEAIFGYAVGLDMTRRDLQARFKEKRQPWEMSKAFDHSAPCSALTPRAAIGALRKGRIELRVNGDVRQSGDLAEMIWAVPDLISKLSALVEIAPGDLIFTGTPAGIGPVVKGDKLEATIAGLEPLSIVIG